VTANTIAIFHWTWRGCEVNRKRLIAQIHIAKKQLGIDEESYRALLQRHGGASCTELDVYQLSKVVAELKQKGFKPKRPTKKRGPKSSEFKSQGDKIRALWLAMAKQGIIRSKEETALRAYVKRMSGGRFEAPQFCDAATASRIIEALKQWQNRELDKQKLNQESQG